MLLVEDIQEYLETELSERIGNLAAEGLLDFVLSQVTPYVYNQAIADARKISMQQMERTDEELSFLVKPRKRRK